MSLITQIKPQKNKKRFNVFVDGKFSFALPAEALAKAGIRANDEITPEEIEKLIKENEFQKILDRVLNFLSFRPRSKKEILDFLVKKQSGEKTQKMVMARLKDLGMVDDKAFAEWWVEQRKNFRPKGVRGLKAELIKKGINKELIEEAIGKIIDEESLARVSLEKKIETFRKLPPEKFRQKVTSFLAYRGFSWDTIKKILDNRDFENDN